MSARMPDANSHILSLKPKFVEHYKDLLGERYDEFIECSFSFLTRSFRVNTLKSDIKTIHSRLSKHFSLHQVPWCPEGFWIKGERRDIGNTLEHALGLIYVQEAASMIPPIVLDPKPGEVVLDMAAAPGSKTCQMAAMMENTGALIANDIKPDRLKPLGLNLQRCGVRNTAMIWGVGQRFREPIFDRILLDAPCSGTGNIRRSLKTIRIWNPGMISRLSKTQCDLADAAFDALKPGGIMVYSTCSVEPIENEVVIEHILRDNKNASLENINLQGLKRSPVISSSKEFDLNKCVRLWPQDNDTEGFFVAKIKKNHL